MDVLSQTLATVKVRVSTSMTTRNKLLIPEQGMTIQVSGIAKWAVLHTATDVLFTTECGGAFVNAGDSLNVSPWTIEWADGSSVRSVAPAAATPAKKAESARDYDDELEMEPVPETFRFTLPFGYEMMVLEYAKENNLDPHEAAKKLMIKGLEQRK
jgi:hypothetical protein